jgi:hypothetical protein
VGTEVQFQGCQHEIYGGISSAGQYFLSSFLLPVIQCFISVVPKYSLIAGKLMTRAK